jgi:uncharacterized protein YggU (UPF0235/DUF167 family)
VGRGGVTVTVRLTPKGGRDAIEGIQHSADGQCMLKARVRAVASDGAANDALLRLVARALGVPPRDVTLATGATSRVKRLSIAGDGPTLAAALEKIAVVR